MSKSDLDELRKVILTLRNAGMVSHYMCSNPHEDDCDCGANWHYRNVVSAYEAARAIVDDMLVIDALTQKRVLRRKE